MPKTSKLEIIPADARARGFSFMAAAVAVYVVLRFAGFHKLFEDDAEGIDLLLQIIGTLYSVVYAFATFVIWGQFAAVESEILQEAGALKDLVVFSRGIREPSRDPMVRAVRAYAKGVIESEWGTLSRGEHTEKTDKLFSTVISAVTDIKPESEAERSVYERVLDRQSGQRTPRRKARDQCQTHAAHIISFRDAHCDHDSVSPVLLSLSQPGAGRRRDRRRNHAAVPGIFCAHGPG